MNVRLQYDLEFLAGIYYNNCLQLNNYEVSINLLTKTTDSASTNIAMERLKAFVHSILTSTVFINQANQERAEFLQMIGCNVTTLPEEPVDQIVGMMLYYKLNAIMEDRMVINSLDIASRLGDGVWYQHDAEDSAGPFATDGWWHKSSTQHETIESEKAPGNVVKVISTGWHEMVLEWPENTLPPGDNTVVYGKFPRNEK
jgi:hypothetical protein